MSTNCDKISYHLSPSVKLGQIKSRFSFQSWWQIDVSFQWSWHWGQAFYQFLTYFLNILEFFEFRFQGLVPWLLLEFLTSSLVISLICVLTIDNISDKISISILDHMDTRSSFFHQLKLIKFSHIFLRSSAQKWIVWHDVVAINVGQMLMNIWREILPSCTIWQHWYHFTIPEHRQLW